MGLLQVNSMGSGVSSGVSGGASWLRTPIWQVMVAEVVGTVGLVYIVTLLLNLSDPRIPALGIAAGVLGLIAIFGNISGAHFNPAVTISFFLCESRLPLGRAMIYVLSECFGAIGGMYLALATIRGVVPYDALANPYAVQAYYDKGYSLLQIGLTEMLWTSILTAVCLRGGMVAQDPSPFTPFFVAAVIVSGSWAGGGVSGCCMNPAIGLAYAIKTGSLIDALMYTISPLSGAILGAFITILFDPSLWIKRINSVRDRPLASTNLNGSTCPIDPDSALPPDREPVLSHGPSGSGVHGPSGPRPNSQRAPEFSAAKYRGAGSTNISPPNNFSAQWEP